MTDNRHIFLHLARMGGSEMHYIEEAFATNWVAPLGPNVEAFEKSLEQYYPSRHAAVLSSGTAAIHLALVMLGVKAGDEVIVQSFTFCATANPITYLGAKPVFVDSEPNTWNISPTLLRQAIEDRISRTGRKPKAIIAVDLYGMPAKWDEIEDIASSYGIPLIEDSAEAMGSRYKGKKCGCFGKYGILSFNGNKIITTSGGGALLCNTQEEKEKAVFYSTQAREKADYYQHEEIGYNYRMSNICAGIGRGQMEVLEKHLAHHKTLHNLYCKAFKDINGISVHSNPDSRFDSNYWLTNILIDKEKCCKDCTQVMHHLAKSGIESRRLWKPMHMQPVYADAPAYTDGTAERIFDKGLCLPSGPCVSIEDAEFVVKTIKDFLS